MSVDMTLAVETARVAMGLEEFRAKIAAHNIATASLPCSQAMQFDASAARNQLKANTGSDQLFLQSLRALEHDFNSFLRPQSSATPLALDAEVAEVSAASGRYQALADGVSRQFALMQLSIRGGR